MLDLAALHATTAHGHVNTPALREQLRTMLTDEGSAAVAALFARGEQPRD